MLRKNSARTTGAVFIYTVMTLTLLFISSACSQNDSIVESTANLSESEALYKIAESDEVLQSFDSNFNESETASFLAKTDETVYPVNVMHKIDSRSFNLDLTIEGDTAYGVSTKTFTGTLIIEAAYEDFSIGDSAVVDTVIEKPFTTVVTRNVVFVKAAETGDLTKDWKIVSISLPEGGTGSANIYITKLTVTFADGEVIEITSPNDYYLSRNTDNRMGNRGNEGLGGPNGNVGNGNKGGRGNQGGPRGIGPKDGFDPSHIGQFPRFTPGEPVKLTVELESAYSDTDHVALSFGANKQGQNRNKRLFELTSSVSNGATYSKVYEGEFEPRAMRGFFHAIVHAVPYHVIHDDATPVEKVSWGVPYEIQ